MAYPFAQDGATAATTKSVGTRLAQVANRRTRRARHARPGADSYRKLLFQPLEPRVLLSADFPVGAPDALLEGLEEFAAWTDELANAGALARPLPLVSRSLGEEVVNANLVRGQLIAPIAAYFDAAATPPNHGRAARPPGRSAGRALQRSHR